MFSDREAKDFCDFNNPVQGIKKNAQFRPKETASVFVVWFCSLPSTFAFQQDSQGKALAVNHGDAAIGGEYLWGIVCECIVSLWAC